MQPLAQPQQYQVSQERTRCNCPLRTAHRRGASVASGPFGASIERSSRGASRETSLHTLSPRRCDADKHVRTSRSRTSLVRPPLELQRWRLHPLRAAQLGARRNAKTYVPWKTGASIELTLAGCSLRNPSTSESQCSCQHVSP